MQVATVLLCLDAVSEGCAPLTEIKNNNLHTKAADVCSLSELRLLLFYGFNWLKTSPISSSIQIACVLISFGQMAWPWLIQA